MGRRSSARRSSCRRPSRERWTDGLPGAVSGRGAAAIVAAADRVLRHEFDLLGSGCVDARAGAAVAHRLQDAAASGRSTTRRGIRLRRARSPDRRQGAVGAEPLSALHGARAGLLADRRRALRAGVRRRGQRLDRAQPVGLRRELGVRDGRRAARRQLDLGLLLHGRLGRVRLAGVSRRVPARRCTCTASSSRPTSSAATSTATTTCATASAWSSSARSSARRGRAGGG